MNTTFRRKNAASRLQTRDERKNDSVILSPFSKLGINSFKESCRRFLSSPVWILSFLILAACDFHGPWEYYPEEREVYTGIYTYGYVASGEAPYICFSKVYELDETSAQDFAFYSKARVTVEGRFDGDAGKGEKLVLSLEPVNKHPGCFSYNDWRIYIEGVPHVNPYEGIVGESYTMNAYFEWDSAGHSVKSSYRAVATIPNPVTVKGLNIPLEDGSYNWVDYKNGKTVEMNFLEYPNDMEFVKVALGYDWSVRGVLSIMNYGFENGESPNTTVNKMFEGMTDEDEMGYRGIAMHDPLESQQNLGYMSNRTVAGFKSLDTLYLMNMSVPLGKFSVDFYSTDAAYIDYIDKVRQSTSDSRVVPKSNIENGMGVFTGMARTSINFNVKGESFISMEHIANRGCSNTEGDNADSWDSKGCRLFLDVLCSGSLEYGSSNDLVQMNEDAYKYYQGDKYRKTAQACYASNVKAAMTLDTTTWSEFLPDTINAEDKKNAYADGLKRYCVASNFKSNHIANCSSLENECLENPEKNSCKEYLWLWCADRNWDLNKYEQCRSALVSRYYLQNLKSSILHREVQKVCDGYYSEVPPAEIVVDGQGENGPMSDVSMCENWCEVKDGRVECE